MKRSPLISKSYVIQIKLNELKEEEEDMKESCSRENKETRCLMVPFSLSSTYIQVNYASRWVIRLHCYHYLLSCLKKNKITYEFLKF